jgi:hypothetical protein
MLDSDVSNADNHLHVEFYTNEEGGDYKGKPFVRIIVPGDKTNIIDQPVREDHKERFPRQWLYFQMKNTDMSVIGTPLQKWNTEFPDDFTRHQMEEMQILKFQTVEQIATASDSQLQRVGMGATGLRERARNYISSVNRKESSSELEETKKQLATLTAQMSSLMEKRKPGRPPKEVEA